MKLFKPLYERALQWSKHRHALPALGILSFFEAFIFPIAPEVMLAPMCLAAPKRGFLYAGVSLACALLGCLVGYAIGHYALDLAEPWMRSLGYWDGFLKVRESIVANGFWFLLVGGFIPVPFKIFTIAAGAVGMPMLPFLAGAAIGRGKRVFLVALLIRLGGERAEAWLHRYVEPIGYTVIALLVIAAVAIKVIR